MELLLAVGVVVLLGAAAVLSLAALGGGSPVPEAAESLATGMRMARAEAGTLGRTVRIVPDAETETLAVWIEADPQAEPGVFEPWTGCTWSRFLENDRVRVLSSELRGPDVPPLSEADEEAVRYRPITFYPDGSSDSAEVLLGARREDDPTRVRVTINGMSGAIRVEATSDDAESGN